MIEEFPFIDINEYNIDKVKAITLRSLLCVNEKYRSSMNKRFLLERYLQVYGVTI